MKRFSFLMVFGSLMLAPLSGVADEGLGRLFYTPDQRARMDVARQHERSIKIDEEESAPQSADIQLNGVITRSDGKSTLWINNKVHSGDLSQQGVELGSDKRGRASQVRIAIPSTRRSVPLKVGQSIDITSGQVEEVYRRAPPAAIPGKDAVPASSASGMGKSPPPNSRKGEASDLSVESQDETSPPR